jgi:hypothetical protein
VRVLTSEQRPLTSSWSSSEGRSERVALRRERNPRSRWSTWCATATDIRRPTGVTRSVPEATLLAVADTAMRIGFPIQAKKRIAGLRMSATDFDWSTGHGPAVAGPLASLILVMAGRKAPLEDLRGDGMQTIQARV